MNPFRAALQLPLALPAYHRQCRQAWALRSDKVTKVVYGHHPRQYVLAVEPVAFVRPGHYAFYFHGGGWTFGRPEQFLAAAIPWLEQGYRIFLPSYRRPPEVGLNRIVQDCRAAVARVVPNEPAIDLQLGGISAGAHLATLLALDSEAWRTGRWSNPPTAVLACAGPLDFGLLRPRRVFLPRYRHLDPSARLDVAEARNQRWLLVHGTADATVTVAHSRNFHRHLTEAGAPADIMELPGGTHLDAGRWMFGGAGAEEVRRFIGGNRPT